MKRVLSGPLFLSPAPTLPEVLITDLCGASTQRHRPQLGEGPRALVSEGPRALVSEGPGRSIKSCASPDSLSQIFG